MDHDGHGNGESGVQHIELDTVVLTYDRARDKLEIGGKAFSLDLMLDLLGRATRALEAKMRMQQALEMRASFEQAARDQAIADALRRGGR
jgi:hypothetical protein